MKSDSKESNNDLLIKGFGQDAQSPTKGKEKRNRYALDESLDNVGVNGFRSDSINDMIN